MKKEPLISVIIPTYNRAHLIGETLDSVLAQTYQNWECIIVDDGSSDNTDEVISEYVKKDSRFKYFHRPDEHLPGGNGSRNYGFKMSKGEYIQWFDSDDLMMAEKLELKVKAMLENDLDFVICSGQSSDFNFMKVNNKIVSIGDNLFESYVLWTSHIMLPSLMFKKQFLNSKKLFEESMTRAQENEFFSRIFYQNNFKYDIIETPLYIYLQHNENKKTQQREKYRSDFIHFFAYVSLKNFERGLSIDNFKVANYHLKRLVDLLFQSYHESDKANFIFIYSNLMVIKSKSRGLLFLLIKLSFIFLQIKIRIPYVLEKKIKKLV